MKRVVVFFCMMIFCFVEKGYGFDKDKVSKLADSYVQAAKEQNFKVDDISELKNIKVNKKYGYRKYKTADRIIEYNLKENSDKTMSGTYSEYSLKEKVGTGMVVDHDIVKNIHMSYVEDGSKLDLYIYPNNSGKSKIKLTLIPLNEALNKTLNITSDMKLISNTKQTRDNCSLTIDEYSNGKRTLLKMVWIDYSKNGKMTIIGDANRDDEYRVDYEGWVEN